MSSEEELEKNANGSAGHGVGTGGSFQQLRRPALRALIQDFSPVWFTWCMNSGALALLIHQCPYRFSGIDILANIFFVTALTTYPVFSVLFIARFVWFGKAAYNEIISNINELTFTSCWAIAFMTLTSCVSLFVSTAWWGGYPFSLVAYVMWLIVHTANIYLLGFVQFWNMCLLFWAFTTLIRRHEISDVRMPTSIIIPAVSVSTIGVTGAIVSTYSYNLSARLAVPILIVSFNWVGVGILMGIILSVYLLHALLAQGWPPPDQTPTVFILVGPMGQSAACLQILGAAASVYHRFGDYNSGTFLTAEAAKGLAAACELIALLLNGMGIIWLLFGIFAMLERAIHRELQWTMSWNAIVFPNATLATSMLVFSISMDSPAYRVITVIMIIALVIVYLINLVYTVLRVWQGQILIVREDWRVRQELEQQKEK